MSAFPFLAAFLLIRRLQRLLKFSPVWGKWMSQFTMASWITVGLYILAVVFLHEGLIKIFGGAILLGAIMFGEKEPDFQSVISFIKAHYPLAAASLLAGLVQFIAPKFYYKYDNYFDFAIIAGFVWIFARWATTKKQREEFNFV